VDLGFDNVARCALISQRAKVPDRTFHVANLTDVSTRDLGAASACLSLFEHNDARAQVVRGYGRRGARGSESNDHDIRAFVSSHLFLLAPSESGPGMHAAASPE
jgi:hypothetical protein